MMLIRTNKEDFYRLVGPGTFHKYQNSTGDPVCITFYDGPRGEGGELIGRVECDCIGPKGELDRENHKRFYKYFMSTEL